MDRPSYTRDDTQDDPKQAPPDASKSSVDIGQVVVVRDYMYSLGHSSWLTLVGKRYRGV
jgi:hypothetical protein